MSWLSNASQETKDWFESLTAVATHPNAPAAVAEFNAAKSAVAQTVQSAQQDQTEIESFLPLITGVLSLVPATAPVASALNEADTALKAVESENPNG